MSGDGKRRKVVVRIESGGVRRVRNGKRPMSGEINLGPNERLISCDFTRVDNETAGYSDWSWTAYIERTVEVAAR